MAKLISLKDSYTKLYKTSTVVKRNQYCTTMARKKKKQKSFSLHWQALLTSLLEMGINN
jgi:hypothetical protein